jgi:hypothetical protein
LRFARLLLLPPGAVVADAAALLAAPFPLPLPSLLLRLASLVASLCARPRDLDADVGFAAVLGAASLGVGGLGGGEDFGLSRNLTMAGQVAAALDSLHEFMAFPHSYLVAAKRNQQSGSPFSNSNHPNSAERNRLLEGLSLSVCPSDIFRSVARNQSVRPLATS